MSINELTSKKKKYVEKQKKNRFQLRIQSAVEVGPAEQELAPAPA